MTSKKITDRLKEEEGISKELSFGIHANGAVDPTGEYPRRENWYGNSVSAAGRGVKINQLWTGGGALGVNFDIPDAQPSLFPFNQANETPSGHSFEIDDTPGAERVLVKHHTGSGVELKPDGSVVVSSRSNRIEVVGADHNMVVQGQGNIVYDGDLNLTVNGNYNLTVNGTYNIDVGANENHSVHGTYITEVGDVHQTLVRGNKDVKVYGDVFDFTAGEQKIVTKKDLRMISRKDIISNAKRNVRMTAMDKITGSSGELMTLSSKKTVVTGEKGKIGGENFHHIGSLFTGPDDDLGTNTVFHGNLIGRALEAWTAKYSKNAEFSHAAFRAEVSATSVSISRAAAMLLAKPTSRPSNISIYPNYQFDWGWNVEGRTAWEQQTDFLEGDDPVSPFYSTNKDWFEVWNKTSPYAVRSVMVDEDNTLEDKLSKTYSYTYYFRWTPSTEEIRSKMRTMDGADDSQTSPEKQTDGEKCIKSLRQENRLGAKYSNEGYESPYEAKRTGKSSPNDGARFGVTLLGNPVERTSKVVTPTNRNASNRQILADPVYNPDNLKSMVVSSTKLSKSTTISKFFGAPGSRTSLDFVPIAEERLKLARQYYLHAWLMEGIFGAKEFQKYRLQVTEGYYHPASGIREAYDGSGERIWREPFKESGQKSLVGPYINELKNEGRAVVYSLFNSKGEVDYSATFDLALYIRDTFFYDEVSLDYDMNRADGVMSQQLIVVMPKVDKDFKANFKMKTGTYFNRKVLDGNDLVEISD